MRRRKIACFSMALIMTTLLTGCSLGDVPVVGKLFNKDAGATTDQLVDQTDIIDDTMADTPHIDAEYPAVPVGTVITIDDIFNVLSSAGLSTETVAGYLILDANGVEAAELTIMEDTYFTFIYQMRGADPSEQSQMVIGVKVTDEISVDTPEGLEDGSEVTDGTATGTDENQESQEQQVEEPQAPAAAKYEVFDFSGASSSTFDFTALENGTVYVNSVMNFDIHKVLHSYEYENIAKNMSELVSQYTDVDTAIANKFMVYCIPKAYVYMQALDYEEGADMSAYAGEYVLVLEPIYETYTDPIYQSEDVLMLPLIDDVNALAKEPSDEAKAECDFLLSEEFDDDSTEIEDFYGAMEILMQLASTEDLFIFDDVLNTLVVDYSDMGTPDNMTDDVTWEEYEAGVISGAQESSEQTLEGEQPTEGEQSSTTTTTTTGSTTITETTTTTSTSVIETINKEIANSFRSRHPELFTFFPESDMVYSKFDYRIGDETTIKGTIILPDGTIIPVDGTSTGDAVTGSGLYYGGIGVFGSGDTSSSTGSTGGVFGAGSSSSTGTSETAPTVDTVESEEGSLTVGDEGYETADSDDDEEEDEGINEYEISMGSTSCMVTANNTYRYMIDNQNSSSSEVYVNNKDKRYTIKIVNESDYMQYWTKDHLNRSMNGYSITASDYTGSTDADNTSIVMMNIQYKNNAGEEVTEPYMAYIRNGSEYIIIIPDEAEEAGSETLADILKRCVSIK